jgi:hypothetical protein
MDGFRNVAEWADAFDAGRYHLTTFRKQVASAATVANDFIDYTYFAGNPPANFYASAPLVAAEVEAIRGILLPSVGKSQWMRAITVMSAASSNTNTTNQNQRLCLCDYLLYYPFIDTDAVGEEQVMDNTVALSARGSSGAGVQIMAVAQSASSTIGTFTVSYTNSAGVAGRTTQAAFTKVVAGGGTLVSSDSNVVAGSQQFLNLQGNDTGVRSIQSCTFSAAGGGLMALVLVKPLYNFYSTQECRRNTDLSVGAASQFESLIHHNRPPEFKPGAVLGIVGLGNAGSLASSTLVGYLETYWSA